MTSTRRRVCLVTQTHVSLNPRLVKEADALTVAGHDVRVVALDLVDEHAALDREMMRGRAWRLESIRVPRRRGRFPLGYLQIATRQKAARALFAAGLQADAVAVRALSRYLGPLARAASREQADIVIAHNLPALPAAARAAERLGAQLGFDLEDFHSAELPDDSSHDRERALLTAIERRYLARCDLLSASSAGIADEVARRYAVRRPVVVHNTFPLADRELDPPPPRERRGEGPSLYWYSQVIGPTRGIEQAIRALALLPFAAHLHLRGQIGDEFARTLNELARDLGVADRVHLLPYAPPHTLVALAAQHDIGLAMEQPDTLNRAICATNKLFTYLAAGLAVAATDTPGQRRILDDAPGAGFLYPPRDVNALAAGLERLLSSPTELAAAKRASLAAARARFSWEHDAPVLSGTSRVAGRPRRRKAPSRRVPVEWPWADRMPRLPRLGLLLTHPVQYLAPLFRELTARGEVDLTVMFAHRPTPEEQGVGFGVPFQWDVDLTSGYEHVWLENRSRTAAKGSFASFDTPGVARAIGARGFDVVLVQGWNTRSYWQAMRACWRRGIPVLVRGDTQLGPSRRTVKRAVKRLTYPLFLRRFAACLSVGTRSDEYFHHYGARRIIRSPHFVNYAAFAASAAAARRDRAALRARWGIEPGATVAVFAGKLVPKKHPLDLVTAVARAGRPDLHLLIVGDGELRDACARAVTDGGVRATFAGFMNQTEIPSAYAAADMLVLPSDAGETWGLVVNEAMACGLPALVSDEVGCAPDHIIEGETGHRFALGDTSGLAALLAAGAGDPDRLRRMGERARTHVAAFSVDASAAGVEEGVRVALREDRRPAAVAAAPVRGGT